MARLMSQISFPVRLTLNFILRWLGHWRWYVRFAAVLLVFDVLAATPHRLQPDSAHVVETFNHQVCVHTSLINEVDEWRIQKSLQLIREMGATTIVEFFPWAYIELSEGEYHWQQADMIVRHARNQGIRIIARLGLVPSWARPNGTASNHLPAESVDEFARFAAAFAERFRGTVDHILIWNEPNLTFEWGFQDVNASTYVQLLQTTYDPIHTANPNAVVLAGALAPTIEPPGSPRGLNDLLYLEGMYLAGAAPYFDALAIHTYGLKYAPDTAPDSDLLNFRRAELVYEIMVRYDQPDKPVYVTESGWNDNPRWTHGVRPAQRIVNTLDAFKWAKTNWPWLETLCIWEFRKSHPSYTYRDNFTLVNSDFQPKAVYYAVQDYARGWESNTPLWLPAPTDQSKQEQALDSASP